MKEAVKISSYDNDSPQNYPDVPEFIGGPHRLYVHQGSFKTTETGQTLASEGFAACSGIIIKGKKGLMHALFHVLPWQDLYENDYKRLEGLAGGELILIEGSGSTSKIWVINDLNKHLGISHVDTLPLDTISPRGGNGHFHVAFKPMVNTLLVARNSHKDLQTFTVFEK
jgi:hypothetical protein